jgi:hypothetical protein
MSTDAWIEEHWIGEAVLPRPRRAPKLPALPVPHAPTCSRGNAALAAHAQSRDRARHPGDGLSSRQNGRNVVDQQARKLTQPPAVAGIMVRSQIVKANGEPVKIDYMMRRNGESWLISDIYLDGAISEVATRRSEFAAILKSQGIDGLIAALNRKADILTATTAKAS